MVALGRIDQAVEDSLGMGKLVADDMELVGYIVAVVAFGSLEEIGDSFVAVGVVVLVVAVVELPLE